MTDKEKINLLRSVLVHLETVLHIVKIQAPVDDLIKEIQTALEDTR